MTVSQVSKMIISRLRELIELLYREPPSS